MTVMMKRNIAVALATILMLLNFNAVSNSSVYAQSAVELRGTVVDETNAYIPAVPITLDDGKGNKLNTVADDQGRYRFTGLKPGLYTLTVEVEGFAKFTQEIDLTKRSTTFDIKLQVGISEQVEVKNDSPGISTEPDKNLSAITLTEKDLEGLPDDPDELLDTLKQMAGAGGEDAQVYVGGFRERGQIPPKEAILRININQNPFSAEYTERSGSRIEIITKPGTDTFHGGFNLNFNDESLNARDPFALTRAPFQRRMFGGYFSGPIIRNRWGFFFNLHRMETDGNDVTNAIVLNPTTLLPEPFSATILTPQRSINFDIRTDYLASKRHTLGLQFRHSTSERIGGTGGGFTLPERATTNNNGEDTLRFSLTTIASERAVNEARIQLSRNHSMSRALTDAITINVLDAFNGGGSQSFTDNENRNLDFTDTVTYTYKKHTIKAGFRAEGVQLDNLNRSNFRGTFTFGRDFERDESGKIILGPDGAPIPISPIELYSRVVRGVPGYRPSQFSINRGDPFIGFSQWQMGWFAQDDWNVSPRLSLSLGLRHDFQTHLDDKLNFAPRFGMSFKVDKKTVIRGGGGVFYSWIDTGITSDTIRLDGLHQQQFVIQQPNFFPDIPGNIGEATRIQPTIRTKSEGLNAPYTVLGQVSLERQLPKNIFGSLTYTWIRGIHLLRSRNINAPVEFENGLPVLPFPGEGPILQYESTGLSTRHEMTVNLRTNISQKLTLWGNYTLAFAHSNTDGAGTMPANPYDFSTEWGRAANDIRHNFFIGGSVSLPWALRITPFITARSGLPFNITTGRDNNRDNQFSDRPSFASPDDPNAIVTPFGIFNPDPRPGEQIIPRNFGQSDPYFNANLGISKTIGFGPPPSNNWPGMAAANRGGQQNSQGGQQAGQQGNAQNQNQRGGNRGGQGRGGAGARGFGGAQVAMMRGGGAMMGGPGAFFGDNRHRYNLTISLNFNNLLNHTNPDRFIGTLTSPLFGHANRSASGGGFGGPGAFFGPGGARRVELGLNFRF